jgi:hypothetical protein
MNITRTLWASATALAIALPGTATGAAGPKDGQPIKAELLASGLAGSIGGTIGPDGALYVPQFALGEITRIDPKTGAMTTFASGFPLPALAAIEFPGGVFDVAFVGDTAYALVTMVDAPDFLPFPDTGSNGVYRIEESGSLTLVADLGAFSRDNAPAGGFPFEVPPGETGFAYVLPEGVQYALEPVADGLLVTDGHHNRILHVDFNGGISTVKQYGNVVPAGLDVFRGQVFLAETGAITGSPGSYEEIGEVTAFDLGDPMDDGPVAGGISMAVDVQSGPGNSLYALAQGTWDPELGPDAAGAPAEENTGQLLRINRDGSTSVLLDGINLPTSLHFAGGIAYVVTLSGDVWKVRGISGAARSRHSR